MNVLFSVLSLISALMLVSLVLLYFRYMKKIPIFLETDDLNNGVVYPTLSVIIPACNEEESIEQTIRQLISQDYPTLEVIVVNDRSTDNTGAVLKKMKGQYPQLKVITINDLPPDWLGKNHAIYKGAKESTGEWLLFTDADVLFSAGSLKKAVSYALEHTLDHLAIAPDVFHGSALYRAFLTYFSFAFVCVVMVTRKVGAGAFNLVNASVYHEIGGYEAIAMRIVDDMSFGELVVNKGFKQGFGVSGRGFISVKWYKGVYETIKGFEKNQFATLNYSVSTTLGLCLPILLVHVYPFIGVFFGPIWARTLCGISILSLFAVYSNLSKDINTSSIYIIFHPISALLHIVAGLNSMVKTISRGGVEWRGKLYSIKELKNHI